MRVLEARFRPQDDEPLMVVGHVVWLGSAEGGPALLQPGPALEETGRSQAFMVKLAYLVASTGPDCFARLQQLRSRFWSFVEIAPAQYCNVNSLPGAESKRPA